MKAKAKMKITKVTEKLSSQGQKYYNVDMLEDTEIPKEGGGNWTRVWENTYLPATVGMESPKMLEGLVVEVMINFYPVIRTVGDKNYTDIKCNIVKIG